MQFTLFSLLGIAAFIVGLVLLFSGSKERSDTGDWSSSIQWGYLFSMMGIFAFLASGLKWSLTAVLLLFTLITGATWVWQKIAMKGKTENDSNHFRDYMADFFPIIAVIFLVRTFVVEPFQIPSSSMRPGLIKGDYILVNKFTYGIRVPVLNNVIIPVNKVQRGDVAVFNYPIEPNLNYIKRIVAVEGDVIEYKDKVLKVNGEIQQDIAAGDYNYANDNQANISEQAQRFHATFAGKQFDVLKEEKQPSVWIPTLLHYQDELIKHDLPNELASQCQYESDGSGFQCTVPQGKYFAMGDNRDSSADSRYWGFVDDKQLVGKAMLIWLNAGELSRIGKSIQ